MSIMSILRKKKKRVLGGKCFAFRNQTVTSKYYASGQRVTDFRSKEIYLLHNLFR